MLLNNCDQVRKARVHQNRSWIH